MFSIISIDPVAAGNFNACYVNFVLGSSLSFLFIFFLIFSLPSICADVQVGTIPLFKQKPKNGETMLFN
jgi:hypothetical protein